NTANSKSFEIPAALRSKRSLIASFLISSFAVLFVLFSLTILLIAIYFLVKGSDEPLWLWVVILAIAVTLNAICIYAWKRQKTASFTHIKIDEAGIHYYNKLSGK